MSDPAAEGGLRRRGTTAIVPALTFWALGLATPASGEPTVPPRTLTFQRNEAWNSHDTLGGTRGRRLQSAVSLVLEPGGRARVEDRGTSRDSSTGEHGVSEERTTWTTRWRGSWQQAGTRLRLRLRREQRECRKTVVDRAPPATRGAERRAACKPCARSLALTCEQEALPLDGKASAPVLVWSCHKWPDPASGSRLPWIFGQSRCLEASGGPFERSPGLRPCAARTADAPAGTSSGAE